MIEVSHEINQLIEVLGENQKFANLKEIIQEAVQQQLEQHLVQFQEVVKQSNLAALDVMQEELDLIREESTTVAGAIKRLQEAITPDVSAEEVSKNVVSYQDAISNLQTYGKIIPTVGDVKKHKQKATNKQSWSLFWQTIINIALNELVKSLKRENKNG